MKSKFGKRILATIMFVFVAFGLMPSDLVHALTFTKGQYTGYEFVHDINQPQGTMPAIKYDANGNIAYCMNIAKQTPNGENFSEGEKLDDVAYRIIKNGYPNTSITGDAKTDYFITQSAFWLCVDSSQANQGLFRARKKGQIGVVDQRVTQAVLDLLHKSEAGTETQKIEVNFSNTDLVATYDGNNYVTPYFRVNVDGALSQAKFQMQMKTTVNGVRYQLQNGSFVNEVPMNTNFRVVIPGNATQGEVSLRAVGQVKGGSITLFKSPNPQIQDVARWQEVYVNAQSKDYATIRWSTEGNLEVTKKGDNGELLDGAKFELRNQDGTVVATQVTSGGKATFTDLSIGNYVLVEIEAPTGYVLSSQPVNVTITSGQTTKTEIQNNIIKGKLKVVKKDAETGDVLEGAEFQLIDKATGQVVETLSTGVDGTATSSLHPYGEYIIKETKAPDKYTLNGTEYPATIDKDMQIVEVVVTNTIIKGRVSVKKVDKDIKDLNLSGVEFTIYDVKGNIVDTIVTDNNGEATSKLLNYGNYKMRETKVPTGYTLSNDEWDMIISENDKTYNFNIENEIVKGKIKIVKVDEDTQTPLEGAKFAVYAKEVPGIAKGTLVTTITTGSDGIATTGDLRYGTYEVVEKEAPAGYILDSKTVYELSIKNSSTITKKVTNKILEGKIKIVKTNEDGTPLEGAEFGLYSDKSCKNLVAKKESGKDGVLEFNNIRVGDKYYIKETKAPHSYRIPVDKDGNVHVYEVYAEKTGNNNFIIDGVLQNTLDREVTMTVVNYKGMELPITGSAVMIPLVLVGVGLMSYSLFSKKNKKERQK